MTCTLETERLLLRPPQRRDIPALVPLANNYAVAKNLSKLPHPYTEEHGEDFVARAAEQWEQGSDYPFAITRKADGAYLGGCGLHPKDGPFEFGYWLGQPFWRKGYATEAVRALIDHAFGDLEHDELHASARVTNPASRHVLEKCGFQWTGVGLCRIRAIHSSAPVDRFRLERGIWASLKSWGKMRRVR